MTYRRPVTAPYPEPSGVPAPPPTVDTGRLFRSSGAVHDDAILALAPETADDGTEESAPRATTYGRAERRALSAERGFPASGVWLVVIGVTTLIAIADVIAIPPESVGWLTGVALVAASAYSAFLVRLADRWIAVIAPPIAFLRATLIAGQLALPSSGSSLLVREALMVVTTLSVNAAWIVGAVLVSAALVLVRGRRA